MIEVENLLAIFRWRQRNIVELVAMADVVHSAGKFTVAGNNAGRFTNTPHACGAWVSRTVNKARAEAGSTTPRARLPASNAAKLSPVIHNTGKSAGWPADYDITVKIAPIMRQTNALRQVLSLATAQARRIVARKTGWGRGVFR